MLEGIPSHLKIWRRAYQQYASVRVQGHPGSYYENMIGEKTWDAKSENIESNGYSNWDGALEVEIPVNYRGTRCRCLMSPARDQLSKVRRSYTEYGIEPPFLTFFFSKQAISVLQKVET